MPTPTKIATMKGVREYGEGADVDLWVNADGRVVIRSRNECGNNYTDVDLRDLLDWLSCGSRDLAETEDANKPTRTHSERGGLHLPYHDTRSSFHGHGADCIAFGRDGIGLESGRLWSLWDMVKVYAAQYLRLGEIIRQLSVHYAGLSLTGSGPPPKAIRHLFEEIRNLCGELQMPTARAMVEQSAITPPEGREAFDLLVRFLESQLQASQVLTLEPNLARFWDSKKVLSHEAQRSFPLAHKEMLAAGNCLAIDQPTAAVLHAMRAAETGLWVLAKELNVSFPNNPVERAMSRNIIEQMESAIKVMRNLPRSPKRDADVEFYTKAANQFFYFNDGYRVRAAHAGEFFSIGDAQKIYDHTRDFFEGISTRLRE